MIYVRNDVFPTVSGGFVDEAILKMQHFEILEPAMKVYEAVDQLLGAGVSHFAGMVGSTSAPYASALAAQNQARYVGIRHEQIAAAILDATARLSGQPGCLMVHGGSGLLAASLGIGSAALDCTPMVVLSATQERKAMENGWWQTLDVQKPIADFVKFQTRVERPDQAVAAVRDALRASVSGKPGVAQIDIPIDVSTDELARTMFRRRCGWRRRICSPDWAVEKAIPGALKGLFC